MKEFDKGKKKTSYCITIPGIIQVHNKSSFSPFSKFFGTYYHRHGMLNKGFFDIKAISLSVFCLFHVASKISSCGVIKMVEKKY